MNKLIFVLVGLGFVNSAFATVYSDCAVSKIYAEMDKRNSPGVLSEYVNYLLSCTESAQSFRIHIVGSTANKLLLIGKQNGLHVAVDFDSDPRKMDTYGALPAYKIELQ